MATPPYEERPLDLVLARALHELDRAGNPDDAHLVLLARRGWITLELRGGTTRATLTELGRRELEIYRASGDVGLR